MRGLVMSGGGSLGAWQFGALMALARKKNWNYDLYAGVSVGALNASFLATHPVFPLGVQQLGHIWTEIDDKDIKKNWFLVRELAGLWEPSLYNTNPLKKLVRKYVRPEAYQESGKLLRVGAVSYHSGDYVIFNERDKDIAEGVIGSSAFPAMFNPGKTRDELWGDGGIRTVTPIKSAIDAGCDTLDILVTTYPGVVPSFDEDKPNVIKIAMRALTIMVDEVTLGDVKQALLYNELVEAGARPDKKFVEINLLYPSKPLNFDALSFDPKNIAQMIEQGAEDGHEFAQKL